MKNYIQRHPFLSVLTLAIVFRLLAVIFSKGYMASDDQFQTVDIAYRWLRVGIWDADGNMNWGPYSSGIISRFPLYNILLYLNMKAVMLLGYDSLDRIMYGVRLSHALLSIIGVAAVYKTVEAATASKNWAVIAGLVMAAHFAMPFLAVRNLIEMLGGTLWAVSLLYLYKHRMSSRFAFLMISGLLAGLSWMFRFQMIFAFWIVPIVLWYEYRCLRPALYYGFGVFSMILLAGLADWMWVGTFMGTSLNHLWQGLSEGALYSTSHLIYVAVIAAYFIPPASLVVMFLALRRRFWKNHLVLTASTAAFVIIHTLVANRQERFMIPILPALIVLFVLACHQHYQQHGFFRKHLGLSLSLITFTLLVNFVALGPFTFNYGHKGLVEPLVKIEQLSTSKPSVLFFSPEKSRIFPLNYGGFELIDRSYVHAWEDLDAVFGAGSAESGFDYYLLYPLRSDDLERYRDSLVSRAGPVDLAFYIGPSTIDLILHGLNPEHNVTNEVWVYRHAAP